MKYNDFVDNMQRLVIPLSFFACRFIKNLVVLVWVKFNLSFYGTCANRIEHFRLLIDIFQTEKFSNSTLSFQFHRGGVHLEVIKQKKSSTSKLTINDFHQEDAGTYECRAG
jgi:hypothetical protein